MGRLVILAVVLLVVSPAGAQDATTAGTATSPYPTLENLSVVWPITGDDDADGIVTVRYRAMGEAGFRTGLPLRRVPAGTVEGFGWENMHSGSVFDLIPGTTYEVELTLTDPDGGDATTTLTVATRPEPVVPASATEIPVTPATFDAALASAGPGDVLVLGAGDYAGFTVETDGEPGNPLVIRGTPGAIVTDEIRLDDRSHVWIEDLETRERIVLHGTHDIVVRRSVITTPESGIYALGTRGGAYDAYVCDNVITGPTLSWVDASLGADGMNLGEGVQLSGAGNVVCRNRVRGFRDCLSTWEDTEALDQLSIDFIGNDLDLCADDAIEADFTMGNVRILRNRITNSFVGISGQPTLGGPTYSIRNVMFNVVYSPFKLHRGSVGDVALHNTVVKCGDAFAVYSGVPWAEGYFRNNLFLGGAGGGTYGGYGNGDGDVLRLDTADASCDLDYDGLGSLGTGTFAGSLGSARFSSLAELRAMTTEVHAVELDDSVFMTTPESLATGPFPERTAPDLRLDPAGDAVDRGTTLANVNDGYAGTAPDLGAYEAGSALPSYGPRTSGSMTCGDGAREGSEACDDGNTTAGDGCSATCEIEVPPGTDAGFPCCDAEGPDFDTGTGPRADAGTTTPGSSNCGCTTHRQPAPYFALAILGLALLVRRAR